MPLNIPGLLVPFQLILHPRLVVPHLAVKGSPSSPQFSLSYIFPQEDIRQIDFNALRNAGYRGAVFDKDNCLTRPHKDQLVPELKDAWDQCREVFGEGNVLIVSNSAGTYLDAGGIQSESVTHHLSTSVLSHASLKPAYSCILAIRTYFSSLRSPVQPHELIVVGDRVFTDVVLANRMRRQIHAKGMLSTALSCAFEKQGTVRTENETLQEKGVVPATRMEANGPLAIWTTDVWERESMIMRWFEKRLVEVVQRWSTPPMGEPVNVSRFLKPVVEVERVGIVEGLLARLKRS